ncbi:C2h2-like zinc finger protein [Thalictrum thalictroides]|uniref:C2h2-like zinc finger protein n=1 Tax=Thalictrum thalictroides TaxID=46969 RepID=A0A7J6WNY2_THATH|nr:C2h2-like zinc finger protein [Thalictrum thalictroides]
MAVSTFFPTNTSNKKSTKKKKHEKQSSSSWQQIKNLLSCKYMEVQGPSSQVYNPKMMGSSSSACNSICSFNDVVHGNTRVIVHQRPDPNSSPLSSSSVSQNTSLLSRKPQPVIGSSVRSNGVCRGTTGYTSSSSSRGMQFRKLSGCYECHMIVDPSSSRYQSPRTTICRCSECGEVFPKIDSLELHQAVRHAVSELDPSDSSRNIVEIIFKSSWLKKDNPICKIERILKVHNTQRTIQRFEDCRDAVKLHATTNTKKNPRCAADGNELLRFHCTTISCRLGASGSSTLCGSIPGCGVCTIIRHGFSRKAYNCQGVLTTASSGKAHDDLSCMDGRRAMLVCRVIAGKVRHIFDDQTSATDDRILTVGTYDSVAGCLGIYSDLEELVVFNPRAILPCFVVIYSSSDHQLVL